MASAVLPSDAHVRAREIVNTLCETGAKLVCIDFDATFVSIHTGGAWSSSPEELQPHVRALFLALVPLMCQASIHVAVVTFSPQVELIRAVLSLCFESNVVEKLILRCDDASWKLDKSESIDFVPTWQLCAMHFDRTYKLPYVISAARQASVERGEMIRNRDTILIDDDAKNIRIAIENGISGIYFEPEGAEPRELCRRILKLHTPVAPPPAAPVPANLPLQTPCKRKTVRLLETPEPAHRTSRGPPSVRQHFGTPVVASMPRSKKFSLCTPSPVMKLKSTVDMGRPKSKRVTKSRHRPRNIEEDMHDLHLIKGDAAIGGVSSPHTPTEVARRRPPPLMPCLSTSPRSPDGKYGSFSFVEADG